ncbi:hypothetical protein P9D26_05505 [Bacillus velezensis]|uniref:hypothetical protein n=1 Tax=Bacillus velezensis TaxID=492670 RepID=UPI002DB64254|nr:hypothetical protein [Bacillus velezensis]MEC1392799.1 hypothetical protein [Bacillus velezensis]
MKKVIASCAVLIVIGGIVLSLYKTDTKKLKKNVSCNVEKIDTLKVYTDSWDVKFKKSNSNKATISAEGKQKDKAPVTFQGDGGIWSLVKKNKRMAAFWMDLLLGSRAAQSILMFPIQV